MLNRARWTRESPGMTGWWKPAQQSMNCPNWCMPNSAFPECAGCWRCRKIRQSVNLTTLLEK